MKKSKIIASLFVILIFGFFAGKLVSNILLDDIKDNVVFAASKAKDDIISKDFTAIINGETVTVDSEEDGIDAEITIIDDISDFALMNGSSGHFKLTKNISVPNSVTSLGIETFDGVFNGGGYTISNLKGPFVNNLTGTICNLIIDSPREFNAVLDESTIVKHKIYNTLYGFTTDNSYTQVAPQYFGFVSGKVTAGTIDNVKVNNAKISTNGSTAGEFDTNINTTGYMGFIAGEISQVSFVTNCSVTNSTLVHSSAYAVGGIVGYSNHSSVRGCLVNKLTVTGKNGLAINTMPKAFTGLLVGVTYRGGISEGIVANISQTATPYLSFLGAALYEVNTGTLNLKNIYYDQTVADFSKEGMDEGYEALIQISNDPINSSNATVDEYGHVYDIDESAIGYRRTLSITNIYRYNGTPLSSIIADCNSTIKVGDYALKRDTSTYNIENYVADDEKVLAINYSISEDLTYGDYLKDKVTIEVDTSKTNFDCEVIFQYKFEGSYSFSNLTEESLVTKTAGEYRILYKIRGYTQELEGASGTLNIKPFDLNDAIFNIYSYEYNGSEKKASVNAKTPSGLSLKVSASGTTTATNIGVYDIQVTGKDSLTTGTVAKQWEIKPGTMTLPSSNINKIYDGNSESIKVTAPDNTTLTYSTDGIEYTSTNPTFKDVGTYTVYYKGSNPNYKDASGSATITITQLTLSIVWGETSLVYNGKEQIPTVSFKNIRGDDVVNITGMSGHAIEKGNNYTATILGIDNPNYKLPSEVSTKFKITPIIIEAPQISSKAYTGELLYADIDESEGYVIDGVYYGTKVGQYKFTLSPKYNYAWIGGNTYKLSYTFEITKATNEWVIAPSIENWTYGQEASELIYQSKFGSPGVRYYAEGSDEMLSGVPTEAGNYTVTILTVGTEDFDGELNETLSFTIYKANPTYEVPDNLTAIYGNTLNDISLPSDENGTWSFKEDINTLLDEAKEHTFTLIYTPNDINNYNIVEENVTINVLKVDATYTAPTIISQLTYNGTEQELINAGSTDDGTFEYKLDDGEYSVNIPTAKDAKTYTIYYRIIGDKNHNNVEPQSLQVSISPLNISIVDVTLNDVHISDSDYEFSAASITFDAELSLNDYEISSMTLTGNNEVGTQTVEVVINVTNNNFELLSNTITSTVNINDHEAQEDDGDCTTSVNCKHCDYVFVEAHSAHEAQEDDGDCTTPVNCKHCDYVFVEAHSAHESQEDDGDCTTSVNCKHCDYVFVEAHLEHEAQEDDGDCTTPVNCKHCDYVFVEAHSEHKSQEDDGDCTTPVNCKHCDYVFVEAHSEHKSREDDGDCTTPVICKHCTTVVVETKDHSLSSIHKKDSEGHYTHCENENCEYETSKEKHISIREASEENAEVCTVCDYIIADQLSHTHTNSNELLYDETHHYYACDGCEEKLEKSVHSFTIFTKVDETTHKEICVCGKEKVETHTYGEWIIKKDPSETEKGSKTKTCSCGHAITEEIPAIGSITPHIEPSKGLSTRAIIGIVIGSISLFGFVVFAIFWFIIKKRDFGDLIKLFKKNDNLS